jgi:hypothetical protein
MAGERLSIAVMLRWIGSRLNGKGLGSMRDRRRFADAALAAVYITTAFIPAAEGALAHATCALAAALIYAASHALPDRAP